MMLPIREGGRLALQLPPGHVAAEPPLTPRPPPHLVELRDVHRTYRRGEETVRALRGVSLAVDAGDFLVVTGPSGSG